ncbi:MAG: helix-turn-helix transcriptional regulator [Oscillospiraceae bacterium]|nr:helix-turn-helix transcriptional regulator [Oscillospiraceae bacterium]
MSEILPGLRTRRKAAGISIDGLATMLGVTRQAVFNWESGGTLPTADKLPEIARVLGCSIDDLYSTNNEEDKP